jgi:hypothetical protein
MSWAAEGESLASQFEVVRKYGHLDVAVPASFAEIKITIRIEKLTPLEAARRLASAAGYRLVQTNGRWSAEPIPPAPICPPPDNESTMWLGGQREYPFVDLAARAARPVYHLGYEGIPDVPGAAARRGGAGALPWDSIDENMGPAAATNIYLDNPTALNKMQMEDAWMNWQDDVQAGWDRLDYQLEQLQLQADRLGP